MTNVHEGMPPPIRRRSLPLEPHSGRWAIRDATLRHEGGAAILAINMSEAIMTCAYAILKKLGY
eukprot:280357-Pleurochrysis_carterae.AAC.1